MQANLAIGLLETSSIGRGIETADAMCKTAGIELNRAAPISRGKYIILITGPVGEVESSLRTGAEMAGDSVISRFIIRNVHEQVLPALNRKVAAEKLEAVGVIETKEAMAAIMAADTACKAAGVHLIEINAGSGTGGKGYLTITGEVGAVRTAVSAGVGVVPEGMLVSRTVIPLAHEHLKKALM